MDRRRRCYFRRAVREHVEGIVVGRCQGRWTTGASKVLWRQCARVFNGMFWVTFVHPFEPHAIGGCRVWLPAESSGTLIASSGRITDPADEEAQVAARRANRQPILSSGSLGMLNRGVG